MKRFFKENKLILAACIAVIFIKILAIDFVEVKGVSMKPNLKENDKLIIEKVSKYFNYYEYGDIVILDSHRENNKMDISKYWVKRVIALQGDTIECRNNIIYRNGEQVSEYYIPENTFTSDIPLIKVPEGKMFVLGDNRSNSSDSRVIGFIDYNDILGRVILNLDKIKPLD